MADHKTVYEDCDILIVGGGMAGTGATFSPSSTNQATGKGGLHSVGFGNGNIQSCSGVASGEFAVAGESDGWGTLALDLSKHVNATVQLEFVMEYNGFNQPAYNNSMPGWFIDDFRLGETLPQHGWANFSNWAPTYSPNNPDWFNRDRFVLSAGHESALIYAILYQIGWLNKEDISNFRQLHSNTPGHPEVEIPGIEATTGPLGQGFAMAVGMATAESMLRANIKEHHQEFEDIFDHFTYVVAGDGDFQEPVVLGSGSMAGHWGLSRLIVYYDSNNAQISGKVDRSDSTDYSQVFEGFPSQVFEGFSKF